MPFVLFMINRYISSRCDFLIRSTAFSRHLCKTSEKGKEALKEERQVAVFGGQEYRGMQSLCAGYREKFPVRG